MDVPTDETYRRDLFGRAVKELAPGTRNLIEQALSQALPCVEGMPRQLLEALQLALQEPDPVLMSGLLQREGRRWAEEGHPVVRLAESAIAAVRLLGARLRASPHALGEAVDVVWLAFLSEILAGYVQAREETAANRRSAELAARMKELDALHKVISAANSSLDLASTLHLVVQTVAEVMEVDVCELYLFEPERGTLVLGASVGLNPEVEGQLRLRLGNGVTGWAAQEGRPVVVPDVEEEPHYQYEPSLHEDPYRSLLAVPIVLYTVEKLVGVINVRTRDVRVYTPEEVSFLEMVAGEMAISLENVRLYQETDQQLRQKVDELTTLQRVSAMVASTLDLEETLGLIAEQAAKLGHADMAAIVEWGSLRQEPAVVTGWGLDDQAREHLREWLRRQEVHDRMGVAGRPVVIRADEDTPAGHWARRAGFHSLLCLPLRGREGMLGVICLHTERPEGFVPEQLGLLTVFADQAALALENAHLYSELRRSLEMKSTLLQEMHHRVRNNLQAVASLLNMQMRRARDPRIVRSLEESASRIQSIAAVHDLLCQETLGVTTVQAVAQQVLEVARAHLAWPGLKLRCQVIEEPPLPIGSKEATLLALLVNELFSNAIAHGFADRGEGTVVVDAYRAEERVILQVKDDGQGPEVGPEPREGGLGLQIVQALVTRDLEGTFALQRDGGWTVAIISFPYRPPADVETLSLIPFSVAPAQGR